MDLVHWLNKQELQLKLVDAQKVASAFAQHQKISYLPTVQQLDEVATVYPSWSNEGKIVYYPALVSSKSLRILRKDRGDMSLGGTPLQSKGLKSENHQQAAVMARKIATNRHIGVNLVIGELVHRLQTHTKKLPSI